MLFITMNKSEDWSCWFSIDGLWFSSLKNDSIRSQNLMNPYSKLFCTKSSIWGKADECINVENSTGIRSIIQENQKLQFLVLKLSCFDRITHRRLLQEYTARHRREAFHLLLPTSTLRRLFLKSNVLCFSFDLGVRVPQLRSVSSDMSYS